MTRPRQVFTAGVVAAILIVAAAHLAIGRIHNHLLGADDDRLWLYMTGASLFRADEAAALQDRVSVSMERHGVHPSNAIRVEMRKAYHRNYIAGSAVYRLASVVTRAVLPDPTHDYPTFMASALFTGFVAAYVLTATLVIAIAILARDTTAAVSAGLTVALIGMIESTFALSGTTFAGGQALLPRVGYSSEGPAAEFVVNTIAILANPSVAFSIFGDTPRNHFILAVIGLFTLRAAGRYRAAAVLLLGLSLLHQSHAGLLFACLFVCDAILRPHIYAATSMKIVAVLTLSSFLARESLGPYLDLETPATTAVLATAVAALGLGSMMAFARRQPRWMAAATRRLKAQEPLWADVQILALLWVVTLPLAALANASVDTIGSVYFWSQLHGRLLAILRPGMVLAIVHLPVTHAAASWTPLHARRLAAAAAFTMLPGLWLVSDVPGRPVARLADELRAIDRAVGPGIDWNAIGNRPETEIYYGLARWMESYDLGNRTLR